MELNVRNEGLITIGALSGRFDASEASQVSTWLDAASGQSPARIIINMAGVTFLDSTALSTLVKGMKRCRQQNGDLIICCLQQQVKVIFELTRLDKAFSIHPDEASAIRALQ
ncbi:MAG: STAS domain-containing protein [Chloroflexi bacterium]|nr:STAS domain-containing protein [Chloroflexota bacterium]